MRQWNEFQDDNDDDDDADVPEWKIGRKITISRRLNL